jgi:cell division protein ZapA (FtsZ GTPase activity inhibitor)
MSEAGHKHVVTVEIAGEEYTLRVLATPEHARECAALVDDAIAQALQHGALVQSQKAAILAALSLADQLLRTREELDALRGETSRFATRLARDLETRLADRPDLATPA